MEYDRTIPAKTDGDEAHGAGQVMRFGNVTFEDVGELTLFPAMP